VLRGAEHDFDTLWNRTHDHEARLCDFDLLELDGEGYRPKLRGAWRGIKYVEHLEEDRAMIFRHACKLGLEGIVCKR
jgi:ATP-dependent DNA ligase